MIIIITIVILVMISIATPHREVASPSGSQGPIGNATARSVPSRRNNADTIHSINLSIL